MSWRTVVITHSAKLDYQLGYMVVRQQEVVKLSVDEIETLIIESTAVSLTAALLCELTKRKVKVVFCDEKHNPSSELVSYYGAYDTSAKLKKQVQWDMEIKSSVWTEIVADKIKKQAQHLMKYGMTEGQLLMDYISELEFGDVTNREGHAAKVYFNALFGKEFTRSGDDSINHALNYGYSIILSAFNREIVSKGYLTQIGIFHDNMFNSFNLSSDLMEPFRVIVDRCVYNMKPYKFEHEEKVKLYYMMSETVKIAGRKETISNAISIYTKSIFNALNDRDVSQINFYEYDL